MQKILTKMARLQVDWLFEQTGIRVTEEIIEDYPTQELQERVEHLHFLVQNNPRAAIEPLEKMIEAYPSYPELKNYLFAAYAHTNRPDQARQILNRTLKEHPDYLFAHTNRITTENDPDVLATYVEPLGLPLDIRSFPSRRADGAYHISEFVAFEQAAIHYEARQGDTRAATDRLSQLIRLGVLKEKLRPSAAAINQATLENVSRRVEQRRKQTIRYPVRSSFAGTDRRQPPPLAHPVLSRFYEFPPDEVDHDFIDEVMDLPRATAIADIRAILRDAIDRYDYFFNLSEDEMPYDFHFHALSWLAILGVEEALEDVLDLLRMDETFANFWFGDYLDYQFIPVLYALGQERLPTLFNYLQEPYNAPFSRIAVVEAVVQIGIQNPDRRPEVVAGLQRLFDFYLITTPLPEGLLDTDFLTFAIGHSAELREAQLVPAYRRMDERGWILEDVYGSLTELLRKMDEPVHPSAILELPASPLEYFEKCYEIRQTPPSHPVEAEVEDSPAQELIIEELARTLFPPLDIPPKRPKKDPRLVGEKVEPRKQPKVGRNAPCPCGSGKKYKHCCLRK